MINPNITFPRSALTGRITPERFQYFQFVDKGESLITVTGSITGILRYAEYKVSGEADAEQRAQADAE